jgi:hypothetical protein
MINNPVPSFQVRRWRFAFPKGSDGPTQLEFDETCSFVIIIDSDVHREMLDLKGPGGPEAFDVQLVDVLAAASKVIVTVGGPSDSVRALMTAVEPDEGYAVLVETSSDRFVLWAREIMAARGGAKGLSLVGPRKLVPSDLLERCLLDTDHIHGFNVPPGALLN